MTLQVVIPITAPIDDARREVTENIVEILKQYLERAERGEYSGLAIAGVYQETPKSRPLDSVVSKTTDRAALIGAVSLLNFRILSGGD